MSAKALARFSPSIHGLKAGQLVELVGSRDDVGGSIDQAEQQLGQIVEVFLSGDTLSVQLLDTGEVIQADAQDVRAAVLGYGGRSFDAVVSERSDLDSLQSNLLECFAAKGFCVLKVIEDSRDREDAEASLRQAEAEGSFGRLAQEVEEGYLGRGGRGKAMWLCAEDHSLPYDGLIGKSDSNLTTLSSLLQAHAEDLFGSPLAERTPTLVCMSLSNIEEEEYESKIATDRMLEEYYDTWKRSLVRAMHFLGPSSGTAVLSRKASASFQPPEDTYHISAAPGTIILFREDTFSYMLEEPLDGPTSWLTSFLLRPAPQWDFEDVEGDMEIFERKRGGPPPPTQDLCAICAISIQSCGAMMDHHKEWAAYSAGIDAQLEMPLSRFEYQEYYTEEVDMPNGKTFVKHFAVQDNIEMFDNKYFEISNMEAESMDPMCRQCLEVGFLSLFSLGYTKKWSNTNPVHASVSVGTDKQEWVNMPQAPRSIATNNQLAIMANRINYVFNLKGGSYVMDTACSSSLAAGHLGKVNLLERRWDPLEYHLSLGSSLTLTIYSFIHGSASHMLSPGGRCFTFNATANGYNRGDGTAAMVMKAGSHDDIRLCYFRGSQIGQDGRSASMAAPNGPAQEKCVWGALREARMDPPESTVWECHGTGTSLGDPIEVGAVRKVQIKMKRQEPLLIASSKANMGHLEGSAAAIAMNKCILVVCKTICAPHQHLKTLNPHLEHAAFDALYSSEATNYANTSGHCQVSSFGVGGTNGHAIFWGESFRPPVDHRKKLMLKLTNMTSPIIADGKDPADWEYHGPPYDLKSTERCKIVWSRDPITGDEELRFERHVDEPEPVEFYSTSGNHNEWGEDRMMEGDVPGLLVQEVDVPDSGALEFRVLADGDEDKAIGPQESTQSMTAPLIGPSPDVRTSWLVYGSPGSAVRIELLVPSAGAPRSISWMAL